MAKKLAKKKPKPKQKQKQAQKQSQRTSVTVNINTKSKKKRKVPRATNGNTNRVLQQFAQPLITLPSNLINPPTIPQYGLIPSQLQTRRNDSEAVSMGQRLGSESAMREQMRTGVGVEPNDEQSLSGFSFDSRADTLRNYQEPSVTSGITPSLGSSFTFSSSIPSSFSQGSNAGLSNFTVDTSDKSASSAAPSQPFQVPRVTDFVRERVSNFNIPVRNKESRKSKPNPQIAEGRGNLTNIYATTRTPFRGSVGGLSTEPPQSIGVPMPSNTALRQPDDRYTDRLIRDDTY